jgi:uncharacterized protein
MVRLDKTEARIVGVLIEKQRTVPDTYPMSENALVNGCNQTSNRDPVTSLQSFEVAGALMALHGRNVVVRIEGGSRVVKYRHRIDEMLGLGDHQLAVLAELLLRGPQAPGALKPRVARMGFHGTPEQIEAVLREMAAGSPPLVTQEPRRPRERDHRWRHLLGDGSELGSYAAAEVEDSQPTRSAPPLPHAAGATDDGDAADAVTKRLLALEQRVARLEQALAESSQDDLVPSDDGEPRRKRLGD